MKLDELAAQLQKNEYLVFDKMLNLVMVYSEPAPESPDVDQKLTKAFQVVDGNLVEMDMEKITDQVIDAIQDKVNVRDLLKEVLKTTHAQDLIQAHERLQKPEVKEKVTTRHGCYSIVIPGGDNEDILELVVRS